MQIKIVRETMGGEHPDIIYLIRKIHEIVKKEVRSTSKPRFKVVLRALVDDFWECPLQGTREVISTHVPIKVGLGRVIWEEL